MGLKHQQNIENQIKENQQLAKTQRISVLAHKTSRMKTAVDSSGPNLVSMIIGD
jgi:hypothetical protein